MRGNVFKREFFFVMVFNILDNFDNDFVITLIIFANNGKTYLCNVVVGHTYGRFKPFVYGAYVYA